MLVPSHTPSSSLWSSVPADIWRLQRQTALLSIVFVCSFVGASDSDGGTAADGLQLISPPPVLGWLLSSVVLPSLPVCNCKRVQTNGCRWRRLTYDVVRGEALKLSLLLLLLAWCWDAKLYRYWSLGWVIIGRRYLLPQHTCTIHPSIRFHSVIDSPTHRCYHECCICSRPHSGKLNDVNLLIVNSCFYDVLRYRNCLISF